MFSDTLTGPQKDLKLQPEKSRGGVALTVVGAKSKAAVKGSRVVMFWGDRVPMEILETQFVGRPIHRPEFHHHTKFAQPLPGADI